MSRLPEDFWRRSAAERDLTRLSAAAAGRRALAEERAEARRENAPKPAGARAQRVFDLEKFSSRDGRKDAVLAGDAGFFREKGAARCGFFLSVGREVLIIGKDSQKKERNGEAIGTDHGDCQPEGRRRQDDDKRESGRRAA